MAIAETHTDEHHDDHHDHGEFIAHHFDSPEQQFDSGKLGIWIFLVTEVLFFSGLFVLYTLYRNYHPEIFQVAHHYFCLLYTSPSPRDQRGSRMPSSA